MTDLSHERAPVSTGSALDRIAAMTARHWFLLKGSWPRLVDIFYWPTVNIAVWGFIQTAVLDMSVGLQVALSAILGAVILWDITWRSQLGLALSMFEEIWSRNLGHLLVSPMRPAELIAAAMTVSLIKTVVAVAPATVLAALAFDFNVFSVGPALALFLINLVAFGWSISLVAAGLVIRFGQGAQDMPWAVMFGITPFAAVYYPVATLPGALQWISAGIPASHVFEGLRGVILDGRVDLQALAWAGALNVVWISIGVAAFLALLASARTRGGLIHIGE